MTFEFSSNTLDKISVDKVLVFAFEGEDPVLTQGFLQLDKVLTGLLSEEITAEKFKGKTGEVLSVSPYKKILCSKVSVLGLGKKEEFDGNQLRKAFSLLAKNLKNKTSSIAFSLLSLKESNLDVALQSQMIAEGILLGNYSFARYKEKTKEEKELEAVIISEDNKNNQLKAKEGIKKGELFYEATRLARDFVNEPAAVVTPAFLAQVALDIAKKNKNIKCTVYEKDQIEKMGMGAFLGIAQASGNALRFIHLEYTSGLSSKKLALIGKGITFDTGGVSLKREDSMKDMKCDMAGAAAILGVFSIISKIKPKTNVMGIIAATPNMVSDKSIVPGDVVRSLNGKTIEILNTDAEGRVTMADSLSYAVKKGANEIIDLATLTGASMVALGTDIAAIFSNNNSLKEKVKIAASNAGEKLWELPLEEEYKKLNKSDVADISNIPSSRYGGTITAALFLEEFVDKKPWVHLDIAGPAYFEKGHDLGPKGGSGFGVRTLLNLLEFNL